VIYPVETITGKLNLSFRNIPLCIEAESEITLQQLLRLASSISEKIFLLDSKERAKLHLAAVFTNNFTNHLLNIATGMLDKEKLPHELLKRLAETTVKNAFQLGPIAAQTGPAKRNDQHTIQKHLNELKADTQLYELYRLITKQITDVHNKSKKRVSKS